MPTQVIPASASVFASFRYTAELQDRAPLQAQRFGYTVLVASRVQLQETVSAGTGYIMASPASLAYVERLFSLRGDLTARKRKVLRFPCV